MRPSGNQNPAVIEALIAAGANVQEDTNSGDTPLHLAASNNEAAVVEALIAAGANVQEDEDDDYTPLHFAARNNENLAVLEVLIAAGANVQEDTNSGHTPLHLAAENNENPAVLEALIAVGANVQEGDNAGHTPLYYAATYNENPAVLEALIAVGADREEVDSGTGLFDTAIGIVGGTTIAVAGGGTTEAIRAGIDFAESVITEQPVGDSGGGGSPDVLGSAGNTGGTVEPPLSTDPIAAQEQLLSAIRDSIHEGMCGNFTAVDLGRALEAYLANMESSAQIIPQIVSGGAVVRFIRQPNNNPPFTFESDMPILSSAMRKADTFANYPLPDNIPRFRSDLEALFLPDMARIGTSTEPDGNLLEPAVNVAIVTMYGAVVTARQAAYCGFDLPNFRAR